MNVSKAKIIAGITLIFFLGALTGALGTHIYVNYQFKKFIKKGPQAFLMPRFIRKLERELELTPDQQTQVREIFKKFHQELDQFREKHHPQLEEIVERHIGQIKEKLTPEQQKKMDRIQKRMKKRWLKPPDHFDKHDMGPEPPDRIIFRLKRQLRLTDEQVEKILPIIREEIEKQPVPFKGPHKDGPPDRPDFGPERPPIGPEIGQKLEKILTPEQMAAFRELQKKRREIRHRDMDKFFKPE